MPIEITIPRLGWSMEEGTFVEWLKRDGDAIAAGDPLFVMEGDKAAQEIEALEAGTLHIPTDAPQPGDVVLVGAVVGYLLQGNEPPPAPSAAKPRVAAPVSVVKSVTVETPRLNTPLAPPSASAVAAAPSVRRLARELGVDLNQFSVADRVSESDVRRAAGRGGPTLAPDQVPARNANSSLPRISPRAARLAQTLGIDWTRIHGSGRSGRIRARDLRAAPVATGQPVEPLPTIPGKLQRLSPVRRSIAQRMTASAVQTVPVTLTTKINAASLVARREQFKRQTPPTIPSYNDLIVQAVAGLLPREPLLNACWTEQGIYLYDEIHLAVAVDTDAGLLAPVIRHVGSLSLVEISAQSKDLAQRARAGQLPLSQLTGGTFTVTNLGMFGIDHFTPVINLPQTAILGIGRIIDEPVVVDGQVVAGKTLGLSLTFDHRIIDGAPAARWLQQLAEHLQQPM